MLALAASAALSVGAQMRALQNPTPPPGASVEFAALSLGAGDVDRAAFEPANRPPAEGALLAPRPLLTLSATRAESAYRLRGIDSDEVQGVSYRWWLGSGRAAVGFGFGTVGYAVPVTGQGGGLTVAAPSAGGVPTTLAGSVPTTSLGLRVALGPSTLAYADGWRARGLASDSNDVFYNAKAGIEWKPATSRVGFEGGRLGLQLDSGYRMSFRTRKGGLTVYLRRKF